eukprot:2281285-Amphidinium_carterae.1
MITDCITGSLGTPYHRAYGRAGLGKVQLRALHPQRAHCGCCQSAILWRWQATCKLLQGL